MQRWPHIHADFGPVRFSNEHKPDGVPKTSVHLHDVVSAEPGGFGDTHWVNVRTKGGSTTLFVPDAIAARAIAAALLDQLGAADAPVLEAAQ